MNAPPEPAAMADPSTTEFPEGLPVGDTWLPAPASDDVRFPYDGSVIGRAPVGDTKLARRALDEAVAVRTRVGALPSHIRSTALQSTHDAIAARSADFERLLVLETGKPLVDCRVEVARTLLTLRTSAEEVARLHGETVPLDLLPSGEGLLGFWTRKPIGVVVGIAGFNYPLLLAAHKLAPSIAAGCPVIAKPAPQTPLATLWLVHLLREALYAAGAPRATVQLVTGGPEVGEVLTTDRRIGAVSFTGSAAVGHRIAKDAAPTKTLLELGANAALLVAADADLDAAADAVVRGGYYASGQACISVQRVIVEAAVREEFVALLKQRIPGITTGDPRDPETRVSALIDQGSTNRVRTWVEEAVKSGAVPAAGGDIKDGVIGPALLLDPDPALPVWSEEIFGPVVCLRSVPDMDAAFELANDSRYGLHASVYTASLDTAFAAVERLEAGGVVVNEVPGFRSDTMPYGGVKDSGAGREGPRFAIDELTVTRMAVIRPKTNPKTNPTTNPTTKKDR